MNFEDKMSLLIPAFLRGELSDSERRDVEALAAKSPEFAAEIAFQRNLKTAVHHDEDSFVPGELGWAKLSKAIGAVDAETSVMTPAPSSQVKFWKYAAAILAVAAVGQAGLLGVMATQPDTATQYSFATDETDSLNRVKLGFNPDVSLTIITKTLQLHDASIIAGPSSLGLYDVKFKSEQACADSVDALKAIPAVIDTVTACK